MEIHDWYITTFYYFQQDKDFGKQTLHKGHANPLAEVTTSLKTYQHFTLEKAYLGEDFFWAFTPVAGDFIRIRFFTPVRVERYIHTDKNSSKALEFLCYTCMNANTLLQALSKHNELQMIMLAFGPNCSIAYDEKKAIP